MSGRITFDGLFLGPSGDPNIVADDTPFASGQLGKKGAVPFATRVNVTSGAAKDFDPGATPRVIQYVQRYATDTGAGAAIPGQLAYWRDPVNFVVCASTGSALGGTVNPLVAGVFLGDNGATTKVPLTAGKYGFIQIEGPAPVWVTGTVTTTNQGSVLLPSTVEGMAALPVLTTTAVAAGAGVRPIGVVYGSTTATSGFISALLAVPQVGL